jgi:DNA-binding NarL/FixJ family response regulator
MLCLHHVFMMGCRIVLVENDPFTLAALTDALAYQRCSVVGAFTTAREALATQAELDPQVAVVDLDLGVGPTGIDLAHALRARQPDIGIVILSSYQDPRLAAPHHPEPPYGTSYLSKQDITNIRQVLEQVLATAHAPLRHRSSGTHSLPPMSQTQRDVLSQIAAGMSTQAIAEERGVSAKAVEQTISKLYELFKVPHDSATNQRVRLVRAYLELSGKLT